MNDNKLNELEKSADIHNLLEEVRTMRDEENGQAAPPPFDSLLERIERKEGKRGASVSPWWLVAACLTGLCVGIAMPRPWEAKPHQLLSTQLRIDTIDTSLGESLTQEGFPLHLVVAM
ncbi:MAG: hypothetical protein IJ013_05265 [Bacteroidaceae bacterium]|nr:hypothetical protein [Bacteroidaceae bacterium]